MDRVTFYPDTIDITFSNMPKLWKTLIVIGSISTIILIILLVIIISLMFESKLEAKKEHESQTNNLAEYDDFLNEFANGKKDEVEDYPSLPKIKDFDGNVLKNLMQIEIIS